MKNFRQVAVLVEGQTESAFVTEILGRWMMAANVFVTPVIVKTSRLADGTSFKGGGSDWKHYDKDLRNLLTSTHYRWVSILVDFYAYPRNGPAAACCGGVHQPRQCAEIRARAMADAIANPRFVPHVVLHEFETWVFAAAIGASHVLGDAGVAQALRNEAQSVADDVEMLNDSPQTAPSKRVLRCWPDYGKATDGIEVIREAGLDAVVDRCPGLKGWVQGLLA